MALEQSTFLYMRRLATQSELSLAASDVLHRLEIHGPARVSALAAAVCLSQSSMVPLVQRLEQRGVVRRSSDPADQRAAIISITAAGRKALGQHHRRLAELLDELLATLDTDERRLLRDAASAMLPLIARLKNLEPPNLAAEAVARERT